MPGEQDPQRRGVSERLQGVQRAQVVTERAVAGDDGGAAAEHRIAGEQGTILREQKAEGVRGVAWRADHAQFAARGRHHVPVQETLAAQPVCRIGRPHRRAGEIREPPGAR